MSLRFSADLIAFFFVHSESLTCLLTLLEAAVIAMAIAAIDRISFTVLLMRPPLTMVGSLRMGYSVLK